MEQTSQILVSLLKDNAHAGVAAAWALARLGSPATADAVLAAAKKETERSRVPYNLRNIAGKYVDDGGYRLMHQKIGYLLEALGVLQHQKAAPLLEEYLNPPSPKSNKPIPGKKDVTATLQPELRAAAVWALGKIFADETDGKMAAQLLQRFTPDPKATDHSSVRAMAAIGLGRMKYKPATEELEKGVKEGELPVRLASAGALARIKDEPMTPVEIPPATRHVQWFIEPVEPKSPEEK